MLACTLLYVTEHRFGGTLCQQDVDSGWESKGDNTRAGNGCSLDPKRAQE